MNGNLHTCMPDHGYVDLCIDEQLLHIWGQSLPSGVWLCDGIASQCCYCRANDARSWRNYAWHITCQSTVMEMIHEWPEYMFEDKGHPSHPWPPILSQPQNTIYCGTTVIIITSKSNHCLFWHTKQGRSIDQERSLLVYTVKPPTPISTSLDFTSNSSTQRKCMVIKCLMD